MARRAPEHIAVSAWLRLLKVQALLEREVRRELGAGFTLPQFDVLNQLARRPDGMTFVELSRQLVVTAGNLTGIVGRLEREGMVRRAPHPRDRRAFRLTLTARGMRAMRAHVAVHHRVIAERFSALPARDVRTLRGLLGRLRDGLEVTMDVPIVDGRPRRAPQARRPAAAPPQSPGARPALTARGRQRTLKVSS